MKTITNIDTIYFLLDIENYEKNCNDILSYLQIKKENANLRKETNNLIDELVTLNNLQFKIYPNGTKGFAFILKNDYFEISISKYRSKISGFKPIKIRISAEALWSLGILKSYEIITNWIIQTFGNITQESVYRIDLACHSNIDFISNYKDSYKGDFKKQTVSYSGNNINALCFGSRNNKNIYCRIYNKTLEIQETRNKTWFKEIWYKNGLEISNVWNLEFEIKSDFLRENNLFTVSDIYLHLQDLWRYCTENWLVKIDNSSSRKTRCKTTKDWLGIQNAYNNFSSKGLIKNHIVEEMNSSILVGTIAGFITSYSAGKNIIDYKIATKQLEIDTKKYFKSKNTTFNEVVLNKISARGGVKNE